MLSPALEEAFLDRVDAALQREGIGESDFEEADRRRLLAVISLSCGLFRHDDERRVALIQLLEGSSTTLPSVDALEIRASTTLEELRLYVDPPKDSTLAQHITAQLDALSESNSTILTLRSSILSLLASQSPRSPLHVPPLEAKKAELQLSAETLFAATAKYSLVVKTAATTHLLPPASDPSLLPRLGALHRKEVEAMWNEVVRLEELLELYESQTRADAVSVKHRGGMEKSFTTILDEYRALEVEEKEIRGDLKRFHR